MNPLSLRKTFQFDTLTLARKEITADNYPDQDLDHITEYVHKNMDRYLDTFMDPHQGIYQRITH